ncbi:MAG: universal stress protein [Candidatus Binatus sp.]|uniref:universal stress protein n=1 Tax=Candidatus Binatus sp. TaxID=2811406 RepID=UPI003C70CFD4
MPQFKKILCPLDFDPNSLLALRLATELAQERDATSALLNAFSTIAPAFALLRMGRRIVQ